MQKTKLKPTGDSLLRNNVNIVEESKPFVSNNGKYLLRYVRLKDGRVFLNRVMFLDKKSNHIQRGVSQSSVVGRASHSYPSLLNKKEDNKK